MGCVKDEEIERISTLKASSLATFAYQLRFRNFLNSQDSLLSVRLRSGGDNSRSDQTAKIVYGVTGAYYWPLIYSLSGSHHQVAFVGPAGRSNVAPPLFLFVCSANDCVKALKIHPSSYQLSGVEWADDSHRFDNQQLGSEKTKEMN